MGYFEFRDKVCKACDAQLYRTINAKTENFCYQFGVKVANYAPLLISFFVVLYAALALGIFSASYNSDLYFQWIEEGSRLIEERQFIEDYHSFSISRNEYIIATGQGPDPEMMSNETFQLMFELVNDAIAINVTDNKDPDFPELGWFDLCARVPMPPALLGPMRYFGGKGLPCTMYTGFDCFQEGQFDYDVPSDLRGSLITYKYPDEPLFTNLSQRQLWDKMSGYYNGTNSGQSCTNWVDAPVPENFMFGAVQRMPNGTVTGVHSLQTVMLVKTATQLAQWKCAEKCSAQNQCLKTMRQCYPGCTVSAGTVYGATCLASLPSVYYNQLQGAYLQYCVYGDPNNCPSGMVSAGGNCGICYNETDPQNPVTTACKACQTSLVAASSLPPPIGDGLHNAFADCLKPYVLACLTAVPNGCFTVGSRCEYNCSTTPACAKPSEAEIDAATTVLLNWEQNYMDYMESVSDNYPFKIAYFADRTTDDLVNEAGEADAILIVAGYFAMIVFGCLTLIRYDALQSRLFLGLGGMVLVILSIVGALGFTALVGIVFVPTIVQVLPFLALGLGTYDMFILAFAFRYIPGDTVPAMIGELMKECGPRLLLTALTNIIVFGIGANIPLRAVNLFSAAMCIVVLFNFLILVVAFSALIALHAERIHRDKIDCLCCFQAPSKHTMISSHQDDQLGWFPTKFAEFAFWKPTKIMCILGAAVIFAVGMWGATQIEIGLPLSDIVPKDGAAYKFLSAREQSYGAFPSYIFIRPGVDMAAPNTIAEILRIENALQTVGGMDPKTPIYSTSWLDKFLWYCNDAPGCYTPGNYPPSKIKKKLDNGTIVTSTTFWPANSTQFYYWLNQYFTTQNDGPYYQAFVNLNPDGTILSSRIAVIQAGLSTDQQIVDFIKDTRKITDASFIPCFPGGFLYDLYEQYVNVQHELTSNLGYTALGVVGISFFFLLHPAAVFINICMIALVLAECYGFLALFHLKLNGVSVVNLVLAIGLIVVPTEHITRVFMVTPGTTSDRARIALAKMVFPMTFSTISTFLGELPMEFAKFPYFRLYFFYQYVIIGLLTLFNSFLALPYLLEYFGPPPLIDNKGVNRSNSRDYAHHAVGIEMPALEETSAED